MDKPIPVLEFGIYLRFVVVVVLGHVVTYIAAGTLAFEFIYESALDAGQFDPTLRNPNNPIEFRHVEFWLIPAQLLRGALMGLALCPFLPVMMVWKFTKRFTVLLAILLVFSVWSVTMPGSGSIEGWLYLKPGVAMSLPFPLLGYLEVPCQLSVFSAFVAWRIGILNRKCLLLIDDR